MYQTSPNCTCKLLSTSTFQGKNKTKLACAIWWGLIHFLVSYSKLYVEKRHFACINPPWSNAFAPIDLFVFALMSSGDKKVACAFWWCLMHVIESYSENNNPRITKIREWKIREWKSETNYILVAHNCHVNSK